VGGRGAGARGQRRKAEGEVGSSNTIPSPGSPTFPWGGGRVEGKIVEVEDHKSRLTVVVLCEPLTTESPIAEWQVQVVVNEATERVLKEVVLALPHTNYYLNRVKVR